MTPLREFAAIVVLVATSLSAVACAMGALFAMLEWLSPSELWGLGGALRTGFLATVALGSAPALLVGAPLYWILWRRRHATRLASAVLGSVAGALVAALEPSLVAWGAGCGAATALLTHGLARRRGGPFNRLPEPQHRS